MADTKTAEERSRNMAAIRSTDTRPEIVLRKALWSRGFHYRKNLKSLPGKPDIVLTKYRICIFVDSEFFHGKNFDSGYQSRKYTSLREQIEHSNHPEFWLKKITGNMERDRSVTEKLGNEGWKVIRFWSKDVLRNTESCIAEIEKAVSSGETC